MRVAVLTSVPEIADLAASTVERLGHWPVGVVAARRRRPTPGLSAIDTYTSLPGVPIRIAREPAAVNDHVSALKPDLLLSWVFPWRVRSETLDAATLGGLNFHPSLLPRHRGPNPIGWTIRSGDSDYGVTWHRMTTHFDEGNVLAQESFPVRADDTIEAVNLRMSRIAVRLLAPALERLTAGERGTPQDPLAATYAPPFGADFAEIDLSNPVRYVHDQVRAWSFARGSGSVDGPFATVRGRVLRVLQTAVEPKPDAERAECGDGYIWLTKVELVS